MHTPSTRAGAWLCTALVASQSLTALAADKSQYHLFNPTPDNELRPMTLDVNHYVDDAITVDAGHFQFEVDIVDYVYDRYSPPGHDEVVKAWIFGYSQLRFGLCDRAEMSVGFGGYNEITFEDKVAGTKFKDRGFDNMNAGMKINLWGNEGETKTSLAIAPFVILPTSDISGWDTWSGGVALPFTVQLPYEFNLGLVTGVTWDEGGDISFSNGINLKRNLIHELDGFVEYITDVAEDDGEWGASINTGLTYRLDENAQLFAGMTFGVRNSTDYWPFIGVAYRF